MVGVELSYGNLTPEEFLRTYGEDLERQLQRISVGTQSVERVEAEYEDYEVSYKVEFPWGTPATEAMKEVQVTTNSFAGRLPRELRESMRVSQWSRNSGFLVLSFYSETRSLSDLHAVIDQVLMPQVARVPDADRVSLYNPEQKEIILEIDPESLATHKLFPRDIETAVRAALGGQAGGRLVMGPKTYSIQMPRSVRTLENLNKVLIATPSGNRIHLNEVAKVDLRPSQSDAMSFKTSGAASIVLFASPKVGGNVKRMADEIIAATEKVLPSLPSDIHFRKLVDPSEFINRAVNNVSHEVAIGALLAVLVLYLFIGSLKNVATAAIEIPVSMMMAFLLMKWSGMNLNIISLGGLALSAGMNVDASVVVMENIFRYFERAKGPLTAAARLDLVIEAVREVRFPVVASTIASLVVFIPLAFTSDLSNAVLGDLAKTVVFSHGLSAIVALILVPTVRLQLMNRESNHLPKAPLERQLRWLEETYARLLSKFLERPRLQWQCYLALAILMSALVLFVLPKLPKEIIGLPDTDWVVLRVETKGNSTIRQMESVSDEHEARLLKMHGKSILYTFVQIMSPNSTVIMARLKDKRQMTEIWKALEREFPNTPFNQYIVVPWNPAELPIPNPPHLRLVIRGGDLLDRAETANQIKELLQERQVFARVFTSPYSGYEENILFEPYPELWANLEQKGAAFSTADLADLARVATQGRSIGDLTLNEKRFGLRLTYPERRIRTVEDLGAIPIAVGDKLVPLKALGSLALKRTPPLVYREDGRDLFLVGAKVNKGDETKIPAAREQAAQIVEEWKVERTKSGKINSQSPTLAFEDPDKDRNAAISQLGTAIALSVLLIFLVMVIQFGSAMNALLVLVAVPLGFIGVLLSLWLFGSTVSLNSALGVILLNGLAVANSIILVDFLKKLVDAGAEPRAAAITAAKQRLRPILITSLTTLLGMLPIALGLGEGAKILQPLGIAVGGGLWFSMGLTLFIVPALQVRYLEFARQMQSQKASKRILARIPRPEASTEHYFAAVDKSTHLDENLEEAPSPATSSQSQRSRLRREHETGPDLPEGPLH